MTDIDNLDDVEDIEDIDTSVRKSKKERLETNRPDSFFTIAADIGKKISWKVAIFLFLIYVFINTRTFIDQALGRIKNTVEDGHPNAKGTLVQGLLVILSYIILTILEDASII